MKNWSDSEDRRPLDAHGRSLPQREQPGYYPGFSTLAQQKFWDEATRRKVLDRVHQIPPIRFFTPEEASLMEAVVAHLLPFRRNPHVIPPKVQWPTEWRTEVINHAKAMRLVLIADGDVGACGSEAGQRERPEHTVAP